MANNSTALSQLQNKTYADGSDKVVVWSAVSNSDVLIPVANLFINTAITAANLVISQNNTPANSTINTTQGAMWSDGSYLYVSVANNQTKRIALSPF